MLCKTEKEKIFQSEMVREPMNIWELRKRLKHIAGLCWGLSIDLSTEFEEVERLRSENERQGVEIALLRGELGLRDKRAEKREKELAALPKEERAKREEYLRRKREATARSRKKKIIEEFNKNGKPN